jgi:membrane-bound lytic murein transglycosylase D
MRLKVLMLAAAAILGACSQSPPPTLPAPPPEVIPIDPPELIAVDFSDLSSLESGLEPAPFPEPAGEMPPTSDAKSPTGLNLGGTTIPLVLNSRVQYWIDLFTGNERERFALYLSRQGQFEEMITSKLRERGLPEELIYLALIESGYSPIARSRARAVGMWQFMAATARIEGLVVSDYLDERRHVGRSTEAATQHLQRLYRRFGSWYLAAAAYNSGEGRISRAIARRAPNAPLSDDVFWTIHSLLPRETRDYVPKLIAATIIGRNRERFGFDNVVLLEPAAVDRVMIPDATDFSVIAEAAGVSVEDLVRLNAHLPRQVTPPGRAVEVMLPVGTAPTFQLAYDQIPPEKRVRFLEHTVRRGETLSQIAGRYGTSVSAIQQTNQLRSANRLSIGQRLRIPRGAAIRVAASASRPVPSGGPSSGERPESTPAPSSTTTYRVRAGDSIWAIAQRHGVNMNDLLEWNSLTRRSVIKPGDRLIIRRAS